ncbi:MAG: glycosyltransferase family 4 protein [Anaerolineae bacterium]|nr:glycosyltransferase family 4 protein [Anaerolineae bacterium]
MRIGFITPPLSMSSGWGRYTRDLIAALGAQGVEPVIIGAAGPAQLDIPHAGYHPILPSLNDGRRWVTPRALARLPAVRRLVRGCALVHCAAEPFIPIAALAGRPWVAGAYGTYLPRALKRRVMGRVFAWAVRRAGVVICISRYTEAQVREALPGAPTVVIPPGVHWEHFANAPDAPPPEPKTGPVIVGVGQVKARKGFHVVAQAMQTVRQTHPNAQYVIIGDASSDPALAAQLGALPGVRVLGRVDDSTLRAWYHHADLLAQTPVNVGGKFEGFGLIYLEAGAAGIPSVGAYGSGAEEAIRHEETGLLAPQDDPGATAEALLRLLDDDALRARLGEGARRHAQANGWDRAAAQVMDVYRLGGVDRE